MAPSLSTTSSTSTPTVTASTYKPAPADKPQPNPSRRFPVTPGVLRSIFASSRTVFEERSVSRVAFFRFAGFLISCLAISLASTRGRAIKSSAALLGGLTG